MKVIPADVGAKLRVSIATLRADQYPPDGQKFFSDHEAEYGSYKIKAPS